MATPRLASRCCACGARCALQELTAAITQAIQEAAVRERSGAARSTLAAAGLPEALASAWGGPFSTYVRQGTGPGVHKLAYGLLAAKYALAGRCEEEDMDWLLATPPVTAAVSAAAQGGTPDFEQAATSALLYRQPRGPAADGRCVGCRKNTASPTCRTGCCGNCCTGPCERHEIGC